VALLGGRASDASLTHASDARQPSGNVGVHVRAGVGADADVGVGAGAGADGDGDADVGGVGVGACDCGDASGCAHDCDHADVGSLLSFEEVVGAALLCPEEEGEGDGSASVDADAGADGSVGTD